MNKFIKNLCSKGVVILDGATGTELQRRGLKTGVCPEIWALENREVLIELQREYVNAGSNIVYSFTFGGNKLKLEEYGLGEKVVEINKALAQISKEAVGDKAYVAGSISSTGRQIKPYGDTFFEDVVDSFKVQIRGLVEGGVDLLVIETMSDIQEARAALIAAKETTDLPVMVSITFDKDEKTLTGTDPVVALQTLQSLGADVVGCNCSTGPEQMISIIEKMKKYAKVPLLAKPNAGMPTLVDGKTCFDMKPVDFAKAGVKLVEAGVNIIGGCCGTNPDFIEQLTINVKDLNTNAPNKKSPPMLTSVRKALFVGLDYPFAVIGERINPTGKKTLQQDLRDGKTTVIAKYAKEQLEAGSSILDVNVGMPGIDEKATMLMAVEYLSSTSDLPLCIDSSTPEVIEAAVRIYPGRALINSVSLETVKIKKVLPVAKKYGAMFIALPVDDQGVPDTLDKMKDNMKKILKEAKKYDLDEGDIIADGMVMAASANQAFAKQTLDYVEWCTKKHGLATVLGLSNVSFGLPERKWINSSFLAMAMGKGLSLAIANPSSELLINTVRACEVLNGKDVNCVNYLNVFSQAVTQESKNMGTVKEANNTLELYNAVISGNKAGILDIFKKAVSEGFKMDLLVNEYVIPAIGEVGKRFGDGTFFLPQLLMSAEAVKKVMEYVESSQDVKALNTNKVGTVLIATVKGDIHDIGKNIVALLLRNHNFNVIDLGKDVDSEHIVDEAIKLNADIVALSALMTTTMIEMKEVVRIAKMKKLKAKIMIGGAVVTERYAEEIGADGYSADANSAVILARKLINLK